MGSKNQQKKSKQELFSKDQVKELIESILIAVVLATFIIVFVVQSFVVSGKSMVPTLHNGERLFVNKFIYRFQPPERGDVVVLKPRGDRNHRYIKRVIGLPGDELEIINGNLYINGKQIKEEYINEEYIENRHYRIYNEVKQKYEIFSTGGPFNIPKEHVFVMGDNRNHSTDSRRLDIVGYVSYDAIVGQAFWVYWPLTKMRVLDDVSYPKLSHK